MDSDLKINTGIEPQPPLPIRSLHNFIYCPRLFYYQWVENIFQENADTVEGSHSFRSDFQQLEAVASPVEEVALRRRGRVDWPVHQMPDFY